MVFGTVLVGKGLPQPRRPPQLPNSRKSHQHLEPFAPGDPVFPVRIVLLVLRFQGLQGKKQLCWSHRGTRHTLCPGTDVHWPRQPGNACMTGNHSGYSLGEQRTSASRRFPLCLFSEMLRSNNNAWLQGGFLSLLFLETARKLPGVKNHHCHFHFTGKSAWF